MAKLEEAERRVEEILHFDVPWDEVVALVQEAVLKELAAVGYPHREDVRIDVFTLLGDEPHLGARAIYAAGVARGQDVLKGEEKAQPVEAPAKDKRGWCEVCVAKVPAEKLIHQSYTDAAGDSDTRLECRDKCYLAEQRDKMKATADLCSDLGIC